MDVKWDVSRAIKISLPEQAFLTTWWFSEELSW
jgi:hypothetical protein